MIRLSMLKRPNISQVPRRKVKYWDTRNFKDKSLPFGGKLTNDRFTDHCKETISRNKVLEAKKLFERKYNQLRLENKLKSNFCSMALLIDATKLVREEMNWFKTKQVIGHVTGVEVGDQFDFRALLCLIGLHCQYVHGIDYKKEGGCSLATSIAFSNRYKLASGLHTYKRESSSDVLYYIGKGGNLSVGYKKLEDQKLEGGNLALANSIEARNEVRVIRKLQQLKDCKKSWQFVYDGLYTVESYTQERGRYGKLIFVFKLKRKVGQHELNSSLGSKSIKFADSPRAYGSVSQRKNEKSHILHLDHISATLSSETSPIYKCSPTCRNWIGQQGFRYQLEIFKKQQKGWGVRSRNFIECGRFICEVFGVLGQEKEGEEINDDDDADFKIDEESGNIGRFIKYSSSPNLYADSVLHNHRGNKMPYVRLYASKNIIPRREFTLNCKIL